MKVLVVGMGKVTGRAVVEHCLRAGDEVMVTETSRTDSISTQADDLRALGAKVEVGPHDTNLLNWAELVVPSPGVPPSNVLLREAVQRGIPVWSEVELGARSFSGRLVAVTGTNGKTTTTSLINEVLRAGGVDSVAAGNIGDPFVSAVSRGHDTIVCEVSSFQLEFTSTFHPHVALVLNVADDHYDWHEGHGNYLASKAKITANQTQDDLLIVRALDKGCMRIAASSRARVKAFEVTGSSIVLADGREVVDVADIRLRGRHNAENVLAASEAAAHLGVDVDVIKEVATSFESGEHRMEFVRERNGVVWINDSKATNPDATAKALAGASNVVLIAGGFDRGLDLSALRGTASSVRAVVAIGQTADQIVAAFNGTPSEKAGSMEEAVEAAARIAAAGDTVLLSPACASFDQFASYAERGRRFAKAVMSL